MSAEVTEPNSLPSSPHAGGEREGDLLQLLGESLGRGAALVLFGLEAGLLLGDALEVAGRRFERDAARQKKVARVTVRDFHDVTGATQVLDGLTKDDFHDRC